MKSRTILFRESGISALSAVITLPILITMMILIFDLARIYLVTIFAKEVVLTTAKFATSSSPQTTTPATDQLIKPASGEASSTGRLKFWEDQVTTSAASYHGLEYFTDKELKVFNLAYGFLYDLNPDVAFPIPVPLTSKADLNGEINCSIYFEFVDLGDVEDTATNRSRIYYCRCAIPYIALGLFSPLLGNDYYVVTKSAYAHKSGNIMN